MGKGMRKPLQGPAAPQGLPLGPSVSSPALGSAAETGG